CWPPRSSTSANTPWPKRRRCSPPRESSSDQRTPVRRACEHSIERVGSEAMTNATSKRTSKMEYRRLGRSGLKVSVLSFGSWVSFDTQMGDEPALECMQTAYDAG